MDIYQNRKFITEKNNENFLICYGLLVSKYENSN